MIKKLKKSAKATVMSISLIFFSVAVNPNKAEAFNLEDAENIIKIITALNSLNITKIPLPVNNPYKSCTKDRYFSMESIKRDYNLSTIGKKRQYRAIEERYGVCIERIDIEKKLIGSLDSLVPNSINNRRNKGAEISFNFEIKF